MAKVVIRSIAELKVFNQKLRALSANISTLQKNALERAADEVLSGIHTDMESNDFSKKIIDSTFVGPIEQSPKGAKIHFISDYSSDDGFDVSTAREEGTRDHDVFPKNPDGWLSYIEKDTGKRVFRKHTHPSGIERLLIIETNIDKNEQAFKDSYEREIVSSLNQMVTI